ncbi:MAG: cytochrome b/b6 domain-containing protein [Solirubrobacterales bacterium]
MKYDPLTRLLHLLIAVGITAQMLTSLVMVDPKPGRPPDQWFEIHETLGVALLFVLLAHWLWSVARHFMYAEPMLLFPWLSRPRISDLAADVRASLREVRHGRLPADDRARPLPSAIQGLGLILGVFLAATGTAMAVGMGPQGQMGPVLHAVKEMHEAASPLMWAYLVVHPALAILHQFAGHRSLSRMFGWG